MVTLSIAALQVDLKVKVVKRTNIYQYHKATQLVLIIYKFFKPIFTAMVNVSELLCKTLHCIIINHVLNKLIWIDILKTN